MQMTAPLRRIILHEFQIELPWFTEQNLEFCVMTCGTSINTKRNQISILLPNLLILSKTNMFLKIQPNVQFDPSNWTYPNETRTTLYKLHVETRSIHAFHSLALFQFNN